MPCGLLISLLTLFATLAIAGCTSEQFRDLTGTGLPRASDGVIDLSETDISGGVPLDGEWEFYWNQRLSQTQITGDLILPTHTIRVPGPWHRSIVHEHSPGNLSLRAGNDKDVTRTGVATYRLRVLIDNDSAFGALHLRINNIATSYRVLVDDMVVGIAGRTGDTAQTVVPRWTTDVASFVPTDDEFDLIIQVSNFHNARGGVIHSLELADSNIFARPMRYQRYLHWFLVGALLSIGAYHFVLHLLHRKSRSILWFAVFTTAVAFRLLTTGEPALLTASSLLQWELLMKLEYLTLFVGVPAFGLYAKSLFPEEFPVSLGRILAALAVIPAAFTVLTPARIFGVLNLPYSLLTVGLGIYVAAAVLRAIRSGRRGGIIFLSGFLVLLLFAVNDILYTHSLVRTGNHVGFGALIFVGFQALLLAVRNADAYRRIERLLREKDALRELTNIDSLTEVSNRRHFDEVYIREFQRARREGEPLSLIMVDIDGFKPYNDRYGHQAGDQALFQVAAEIRSRARRASDLVARYGGEEFCIVLPSTDERTASRLAERMRRAIENMRVGHSAIKGSTTTGSNPGAGGRSSHNAGGSPGSAPLSGGDRITASFGVAGMVPHRTSSADALLQLADARLYQAKEAGRNRVVPSPGTFA